MMDIIINESFSDDEAILTKVEKKQFEAPELVNLRLHAEEVAQETEITELLCYGKVKQKLEYDLKYQWDGALKILRDFNGTVLLADEVGLGKTIEAGLVLSQKWAERKRQILVITPSNLRKQWYQ